MKFFSRRNWTNGVKRPWPRRQPPDDGFFDQSAQFVGGMGDYDWTEEWTCYLVDADIAP